MRLAPQHPGGEDAVEQRLDERGAEEVVAARAFELQAQRFFERGADAGQRRQLAGLDPELGFARVGRQEPRQVARRGQRCLVQHHALQELFEALALLIGGRPRVRRLAPEVVLVARQAVRFQNGAVPVGIGADQQEVAVVRDEDLAVARPIILDLLRFRDLPGVRARSASPQSAPPAGIAPQANRWCRCGSGPR